MKVESDQTPGQRPTKKFNRLSDRRFSAQHSIDFLTRSLKRRAPLGVQKPGDLIASLKLINDLHVDIQMALASEPERREIWIGRFTEYLNTAHALRASIMELSPSYERVDDSVEFPAKVVIVSIGTEPDLVPMAEPTANVSWAEVILHGERIEASSEGPYDVLEAFSRANGYAAQFELPRVMVSIADASHWRPEWGELIDAESPQTGEREAGQR